MGNITGRSDADPTALPIQHSPDGVTFNVRVVPRAGRTAAAGVRAGALLVRIAAAPVEGAANAALTDYLAGLLGVPRRQIVIDAGLKSRDKRVRVIGMTRDGVRARLSAILHA